MSRDWGTTTEERNREYPGDQFVPAPRDTYFRGMDIDAPPETVFRWLCQLRVAPYSYDLIDNLGRRSPRQLTPGLENLAIGDRFMTIFELIAFERDRHLTLRIDRARRLFGDSVVTYQLHRAGEGTRLVVKLLFERFPGPAPAHPVYARAMPWLDLVMMRKQLRTIRDLAEGTRQAG